MDDPDSISTSESDLSNAAQPATSGGDEREVLEGEVFRPQERPEQVAGQDGQASDYEGEPRDSVSDAASAGQRESVERGLAQYVFLREEREFAVADLLQFAAEVDL